MRSCTDADIQVDVCNNLLAISFVDFRLHSTLTNLLSGLDPDEKVYADTMVSIKTGPCTLTLTLRNFKIEHQYDIYLYLETSLWISGLRVLI
jgi:hypothetical protein